jgi:hypothetical protein
MIGAFNKQAQRLFLYTKDVEIIAGVCNRSARRILERIKILLGKHSGQVVTVKEFCHCYGLNEDDVRRLMR